MKKRAFVRYSKQGKIVPGSLILTAGSFPQGPSKWNEVPADLCCTQSFNCDSCVILLVLPEEGFYGFSLQTRGTGVNLTGTIYWTPTISESFSLSADASTYDFDHEYPDNNVHTVRLCINNPSQLRDFELGDGPGTAVALSNASALNGIDEWDSDNTDIYALDLTGLSSITEFFHCCSLLRHVNITGCTNLTDVDLFDNSLTIESVDHILITLDDNGLSNGYVDVSGANGIPTALGLAAKTSLEGKGWFVNVNS